MLQGSSYLIKQAKLFTRVADPILKLCWEGRARLGPDWTMTKWVTLSWLDVYIGK